MRYWFIILVTITASSSALAQDSLIHKLDSVSMFSDPRTDSLRKELHRHLDSLNAINHALYEKINTSKAPNLDLPFSDSLSGKSDRYAAVVDEQKGKLQKKIDSLSGLRLHNGRYTRSLDSLNRKNPLNRVVEGEAKVNEKQSEIESKINKPLGKVNEKINQLNGQAEGHGNLPAGFSAQGLNKDLPEVPDLGLNAPDVPVNRPDINTNKLADGAAPDINLDVNTKFKSAMGDNKVTGKVDDISKASQNLSGYSDDVRSVTSGDLRGGSQLQKDAISEINNDQLKAAEGQLTEASGQIEMIKSMKDQEAFKKQAMEKGREIVAQQIALHEGTLSETVNKVSQHQKRAGTVFSKVKGLPKRSVREAKPPVIERFVPGVTVQVQRTNAWLIDINPAVRYRLRSIFSAGIGWNERIVFDGDFNFYRESRMYGVRTFSELSVLKGLWIKADVECMSAFIPVSNAQRDTGERKRIWQYLAGIKKEFSFAPGVVGNVQFMYNLYDPQRTSPYVNRLNVRFGFEFPLRKKSSSKSHL